MDTQTIQYLNQLNQKFYEITAKEFDQTRGRAWAGWQNLRPTLQTLSTPIRVLDVGCGNGRFAHFLRENLDERVEIEYFGLDSSPKLLAFAQDSLVDINNLRPYLTQHDILQELLPTAQFDLVVLFGVMHHIPSAQNRLIMMKMLSDCVDRNGYLIFACWRFYEYERFRRRIVVWDDSIQVEKNDYLLDWRRGERALRYCHYVDDVEHEQLIHGTELSLQETFRADGTTGDLNCYSILQKI